MIIVADLCTFLEAFAPPPLAADWDNVGLLVGDRAQRVSRVMTCLTITPVSAAEAIRDQVDLVVTHHPLPFKPLQRLTADEPSGRMLLDLIRAGIAIYSPHTAFDSAAAGINQLLAAGLELIEIAPLVPWSGLSAVGEGRYGHCAPPQSLGQIAARLKQFLRVGGLHAVGDLQRPIERVAIACGSGGEFLSAASAQGCQLLITGEARFHTCLEAESRGLALLLPGHYASERFGVERLAAELAAQFPSLSIWPSRAESDPLSWL
jgi:dinuclear metal center YbgI/SA1388 family protein